jgi:hypothetical protein
MKKHLILGKKCILIVIVLITGSLFAQQNTEEDSVIIKGLVVGENKHPISCAHVHEIGSDLFTRTNEDGWFRLKKGKNSQILIEFEGMYTLNVLIEDSLCRKYIMEHFKDKNTKTTTEEKIDSNNKDSPQPLMIPKQYILFICTNHNPRHSAAVWDQMIELKNRHGCSF